MTSGSPAFAPRWRAAPRYATGSMATTSASSSLQQPSTGVARRAAHGRVPQHAPSPGGALPSRAILPLPLVVRRSRTGARLTRRTAQAPCRTSARLWAGWPLLLCRGLFTASTAQQPPPPSAQRLPIGASEGGRTTAAKARGPSREKTFHTHLLSPRYVGHTGRLSGP